jgi:hypothetical protein
VILFLPKTKCISQDKHSISPLTSAHPIPSPTPKIPKRRFGWGGREVPQKKSLCPRTPSTFKFNKIYASDLELMKSYSFVKKNQNFLWSFSFTWKGKFSKGMCEKIKVMIKKVFFLKGHLKNNY